LKFQEKEGYLKAKIDDLETKSTTKNIRGLCRGISVFKDYQSKTNIVKDEDGDLVPVSYNSLARWRIHLSQFSECI